MKVSEAMSKVKHLPFFNPWQARIEPDLRLREWTTLAAAVGVRYSGCSFENFEVRGEKQRRTVEAIRTWLDRFANAPGNELRGGLLLYGPPGTGKDHLMIAGLYDLVLSHGIPCQWVDGLTVFAELRSMVGTGGNQAKFAKKLTDPRVLAISDPLPPKGNASEFVTEMLQKVIDRRYREGKSTWVTLNVTNAADAAERLASPIVSRLKHDSLCLPCDWPDFRTAINSKTEAKK